MKRIRYQAQKGRVNTSISINEFISQRTGAKYRVVIDFDEMVFKIRNERTKEFVIKSKTYKNMNVLKSMARKGLEKLGVPLKRESRDRTYGLCRKGYSQSEHERLEELKEDK